jgi:hypothetical protein
MLVMALIASISALVYFILYCKLKKYIPPKPTSKLSWQLALLIIVGGMPAFIVSLVVIVPLNYERINSVKKWCADNNYTYQCCVKDRNGLRLFRCKYSLYVNESIHPIKIQIGNIFWGELNNDIKVLQ